MDTAIDFNSFAKGEGSPKLKGRSDYAGYYAMLASCLNMVVMPQGGVTRRPATLFVGLAKDQTDTPFMSRTVRFIFSTVQAYMLVFTAGNIRVYMNDAPVLNSGSPVDISTSYTAADLPFLKFVQSADTLFILGGSAPGNSGRGYNIATLTRSSHIAWTFATDSFKDGPYLPNVPAATCTLTPSGTSGSVTLTASSTTGINATPSNPGQGFLSTDVGRMVRIQQTNWAWLIITAVADTTHATATVQAKVNNGANGALDSTSASTQFALGKWSDTTGYPYAGSFWQNRLAACATNNQPNAAELSVTGDFPNYAPTQADNSVQANNALSWIISDDQVNAIRALVPAGSAASMQLGIMTTGGEDVMQPATTTQALSGTNVQVYRETEYGIAANVAPIRVGKAVLFFNLPGRKLHEWQWAWSVNGYLGPEKTVDSEHITQSHPVSLPGVVAAAYQQHPHGILWALRGDGQLIGDTYLPEQQVNAWHRHQLGGQYYGGPPIVESIDCIPSPDGSYTELWLTVLRTIGGTPTRTVEVMTRFFDAMPQEQAFFVDCGFLSALTYPAATLSMSAMSGNGVTFSTSADVFASGDVGTNGAGKIIRVNNGVAIVRSFTDARHVIGDWLYPPTMSKSATVNNWSCTAQGTTLNGIGVLNGETVQILGDGADMQTATVSGGGCTVPNGQTASLYAAGLPYAYELVSMPLVPKTAAESVAGKVKKIDHLYARLYETLEAFNFGQHRTDPFTDAIDNPSEPIEMRNNADVLGLPPPLFSGIRRLPMPGGYDLECQWRITGNGPFPLTLLAIGAKGEIDEMQEQGEP